MDPKFRKVVLFVAVIIVFFISFFMVKGCRMKTPEEAVENFDGIELTYYKMFDDSDVIEPIIQEYVAEHPGLKINYKQFVDFKEYMNLVLNEMAEGEGPDIFSMQNTWFASNFRKLAPMPEDIGTVSDFESLFVDVASKDLVQVDENGVRQVYGLPMTVDTLALYYNNDHFEDRLPTQGKPSSTWEGIKNDVVALNKDDNSFSRFEVSGIALGRADNISRAVDIFYLMLLQHDIDFYNRNISEAIFSERQVESGDRNAVEVLEFITSFSNPDHKNYSWNELIVDEDSAEKEVEAFARGDVSMIVGFSYTYNDIVNQINVLRAKGVDTIDESVIRVSQIPQLYDPSISKERRSTYANYFAETVSRNSSQPKLAWDFLRFLTLKKNLDFYFENTHKPTSRRDMIDDQRKHPIYGVFASQIGFAESFPVVDYHKYKDIFSEMINLVAEGEEEPLNALDDAEKEINELLPEEGFLIPEVEVME